MSFKPAASIPIRDSGIVKIIVGLMLLGLVGIYFYNARSINPFGTYSALVDDAYIPLRFADNWAKGFGLVWNPGGAPVEGFTSPLYVFMMFLVEKAGFTPLAYVPLASALFAVLCVAQVLFLLQYINPGRLVENMVGAILLGLSPQLWYWSTAGLETTLFAALLLTCVIVHAAHNAGKVPAWSVGVIFGLLTLTRPEGVLLFGMTLIFDIVLIWRAPTRNYMDPAKVALGFLAVTAPVFLWKWAYFGYPLPNTYYAKAGAGWIQIQGGWNYLVGNLQRILMQSYLLLLVGVFAFLKPVRERLYILCLALSFCLIIILEGGDFFPNARFVTPMLPLLFILAALGISELSSRLKNGYRLLFLGVLIGMAVAAFNPRKALPLTPHHTQLPKANSATFEYFDDWYTGFSVMGKTLHRIGSPGQSIALMPVGAVGYFSGMKVFDMAGVTDPYIAHEPFDPTYDSSWRPGHDKGDGPYILSKHPDYIQLVDRLTSQPLPGIDDLGRTYKSVVEIWNDPEFLNLYEFYPVQVDGRWFYNLYRLKTSPP